MEHLPQGVVADEHGCFVYHIISNRIDIEHIAVRNYPSVGEEFMTDKLFGNGELVSVDLIRPSRVPGSKNGPFLRLSDASGWLFEKKHGEIMAKRILVRSGLWMFRVANFNAGIALRHHPVDRSDVHVKGVSFKPLQKLFCDRKVTHPITGIHFYRVQGTEGWVFDKRMSSDGTTMHPMLLDDELVEEDFKVFECISSVLVRLHPTIEKEKNCSDLVIQTGQLVCVDMSVRDIGGDGNGPFVRLADGSGWLFEMKNHHEVLKPVSVTRGDWKVRIENAPAGIGLRRQPIDSGLFRDNNTTYNPGDIVHCSRMVQATSSGTRFYQVSGTEGWIFCSRDGEATVTVLSESRDHSVVSFKSNGEASWSPEFVRGVAFTVPGVQEISFNETSRVLSFRNEDGDRINVYYTTRTVGTALDHPHQGRTQLFRRDCNSQDLLRILQNPRSHTGKGYKRKYHNDSFPTTTIEQVSSTEYGQGVVIDTELETRNKLVELERQLEAVQQERTQMLKRIRDVDLERAKETEQALAKQGDRAAERNSRLEKKKKKELFDKASKQLLALAAELDRTCGDCGRVFANQRAKEQHWNAVHRIQCQICYKEFGDAHALRQHTEATGHY